VIAKKPPASGVGAVRDGTAVKDKKFYQPYRIFVAKKSKPVSGKARLRKLM
jgi:hypothetical protein